MTSLIGRRLGRYELRAELGRGGMARVYRAVDTLLQRQVAIKVLAAQLSLDPEFVQRFDREATTAANLRHPAQRAHQRRLRRHRHRRPQQHPHPDVRRRPHRPGNRRRRPPHVLSRRPLPLASPLRHLPRHAAWNRRRANPIDAAPMPRGLQR